MMKHLINYRIFENTDIKSMSKRLSDLISKSKQDKHEIKKKLKKDRKEIFKEFKERVDECLYDLIDDFKYIFGSSKHELYCWYVFNIESGDIKKFQKDLQESISKLESIDVNYDLKVSVSRKTGFAGYLLDGGPIEEFNREINKAMENDKKSNNKIANMNGQIEKFEIVINIYNYNLTQP